DLEPRAALDPSPGTLNALRSAHGARSTGSLGRVIVGRLAGIHPGYRTAGETRSASPHRPRGPMDRPPAHDCGRLDGMGAIGEWGRRHPRDSDRSGGGPHGTPTSLWPLAPRRRAERYHPSGSLLRPPPRPPGRLLHCLPPRHADRDIWLKRPSCPQELPGRTPHARPRIGQEIVRVPVRTRTGTRTGANRSESGIVRTARYPGPLVVPRETLVAREGILVEELPVRERSA